MSTREKLVERISSLTEEQVKFLFEITDDMLSADEDNSEIDALCGIFHDAANSHLRELEETA